MAGKVIASPKRLPSKRCFATPNFAKHRLTGMKADAAYAASSPARSKYDLLGALRIEPASSIGQPSPPDRRQFLRCLQRWIFAHRITPMTDLHAAPDPVGVFTNCQRRRHLLHFLNRAEPCSFKGGAQ